MKYLSTIVFLSLTVAASVYDIYTEDLAGRLVIENGDSIIVSPYHKLASLNNKFIIVKVCSTQICRDNYKLLMKNKYRTNGITIEEIK